MVVGDAPTPASTRRLSLAFTPIGEPCLENYDSEFAPSATTESATPASRPTGSSFQRSSPTMAESLDSIAEIDTTTVEGIRAAAKMFKYGFNDEDYLKERGTVPMAQVTKDLQDGSQNEIEEKSAPAEVERTSSRREIDVMPQLARRKSMGEYLTEAAMVDQVCCSYGSVAQDLMIAFVDGCCTQSGATTPSRGTSGVTKGRSSSDVRIVGCHSFHRRYSPGDHCFSTTLSPLVFCSRVLQRPQQVLRGTK